MIWKLYTTIVLLLLCIGKGDINDVAQLVQWNNLTSLSWNSEDARRIYGTLGLRIRPRLKKSHIIAVFIDAYIRQVDV